MAICNSCGQQIPDGIKFCPYCGGATPQAEQQPAPMNPNPIPPIKKTPEPKKKTPFFKNNVILFSCIGAAVVLLLALLFCIYWFFLRPSDRADAYTMYLQDSQLFLTNVADGEPIHLGAADSDADAYENLVAVSEDRALAFFPQDINTDKKTFSLCYRHIARAGEAPIVLDRQVVRYVLVEGGQFPVYLTENKTLYYHGLSIRRQLAEQVTDFRAAEDGSCFYYLDTNQELYYIAGSDAPMLLDEGITAICHLSDDFKTIIYTKETALYRRTIDESAELLSENCLSFKGALANGDVIYLREAEGDRSYYTFINDTNAAADAALQEPQAPITPLPEAYPDEAAFLAAQQKYQQALTAFQEAQQQYALKVSRDRLRDALYSEIPATMQTSLCIYKNGTETLLTESCGDVTVFSEQNAFFYQCYPQDAITKNELSVFNDASEIKSSVDEAIKQTTQWFVTAGDRSVQIHTKVAQQFSISSIDGNQIVYYITQAENTQKLCRFPLSEGAATVIAEQVSTYQHIDDCVAFLRNENGASVLCCDESVLTDSEPQQWFALTDGVCYLAENKLFAYQNGDVSFIAENVTSVFFPTDDYKFID